LVKDKRLEEKPSILEGTFSKPWFVIPNGLKLGIKVKKLGIKFSFPFELNSGFDQIQFLLATTQS
jgi:hypothetical protein